MAFQKQGYIALFDVLGFSERVLRDAFNGRDGSNALDAYIDTVDLIRFGGRVNYVEFVSSSLVEERLQALGGVGMSIRRLLLAAGERPVAI